MKKLSLVLSLLMVVCLAFPHTSHAADFVRIGTSSVGGGFYLVGNTIAQLGQLKMPSANFTAITGGSIKNAINLEKGEIELGLIQSSTLAMALAGKDTFKAPLKKIRWVTAAVYPYPAHILVGTDLGMNSVADFKGKRIDFGAVGAGIEVNIREITSVYGLSQRDFSVERFGRAEYDEAFKTGRIQGTIWTTTMPNAQISDIIRSGKVMAIGIEPEKIKEILEKFPHYSEAVIPANTYEGQPKDILTIGAVGGLLTHADVPEQLIYDITKMMHENAAFLKERLPTYFGEFSLENALLGRGLTLIHPGAEKYYREVGLIKN